MAYCNGRMVSFSIRSTRSIEGAAQRVQEDTIKFSRIMEGLGTSFIESIMVLVQFIPSYSGYHWYTNLFLVIGSMD